MDENHDSLFAELEVEEIGRAAAAFGGCGRSFPLKGLSENNRLTIGIYASMQCL